MDVRTQAESSPRAGRREWIGLAVLALPTLLLALDLSVLYLALPHLGADLNPDSAQLLWITDIYTFMIAGFLITMGTLGDRIGRRRLLMIGAAAFGIVSVLAAYSTSAEMLIVTRGLLGIAGATQLPSVLALISNMFRDAKQRSVAIAVWLSCFMAGAAIGPVVGGLLLEWFWWGSAFLLGVPVMVVLLISAPLLLPEYRDEAHAGRPDLTSVALSLGAILPVIYGIKELAKDGLQAQSTLPILAGTAFGVLFVRRQRRLTNPLLDLRLFSNRAFSAALVILLLGSAVLGAAYLFVTQYLQLVQGLSPLRAGLWLVVQAGGSIVGVMAAPMLARRIGAAYAVGVGLAGAAIGFLVLMWIEPTSGVVIAVTGLVIVFCCTGPMAALGTDLIVGSAPPEKAGSAAAMSETSLELGLALGIALLGSLGTAIYRGQVIDAIPAGTPAGVAEATKDTLAGATAGAAQLPDQVGAPLLNAAQVAFTNGLNTVAGVCAAITVALATLAVLLLRRVRPSAEAPVTEPDAAEPAPAAVPA